MATNDYHFITHWRVQGTLPEIAEIINDAEDLPRWWPSVYLEVRQLAKGDAQGLGKRVSLYTKGWLPYTLRWQFTVTEVRPDGFALVAEGDFVGRGIWTFVQENDQESNWTRMTYDWKIEANKPLLRRFSAFFKPIFSMNHEWAMHNGEISLALELRRRHARGSEAATLPPPPPATPNNPVRWLGFLITHPNSLRVPPR
jgi:hypothetical protein